MKIPAIILGAVLIIGFVYLFQTKVPLCYQSPEEEGIYVIYDISIINEIKKQLKEQTHFFVKISGKSMTPMIKDNDMCLCLPEKNYDEGDIVAFYVQLEDNKINLITHRIVKELNGKFKTKGDNNPGIDNAEINEEQIFCKIPERSIFEKFTFAITEYGKFNLFS